MIRHISVLLGLISMIGCSNATSTVEPNFAKSNALVTTETLNGTVSLGKSINKTIADAEYCKLTVRLTGMIPNQMYLIESTPAVFAYGDVSSGTGSWTFTGYILKSELPYVTMYRYVNYTKVALTPDYPLLQHPDVTVTNRCY